MDLPEIPSWVTLGGGGVSVGAILLLVHWFRGYLKEERTERQEIEAKREAARLAHDAKRDETLKTMADQCHSHSEKITAAYHAAIEKQGARLDENTRAFAIASDIMRQCQEEHAKGAKA